MSSMSAESGGSAPRPRSGGSVWPWIIGGCGVLALLGVVVVGIMLGLLLPAVSKVREGARRKACQSNLRQIGVACQMYAMDNGDVFPDSLAAMYPMYVDNQRLYVCPSTRASGAAGGATSYGLQPWLDSALPGDFIVAYDLSPDSHNGDGFNVLYLDSHVEWWAAERAGELQQLLDEQAAVLERLHESPGDRQKILQEYGAAGGDVTVPGGVPALPPIPMKPGDIGIE